VEFRELYLEGALEILPTVYEDDRGYFYESFNNKLKGKLKTDFVQSNHSFSKKGVLRGLHFQRGWFRQGKLVRVTHGKATDVIVDLRDGSATFGKHLKIELSAEKHNMLWVPRGFAHGFLAMTDCVFQYKCDNPYNKATDNGIRWDDPTLDIDWGIDTPTISKKDSLLGPFCKDAVYFTM
jgi:dTDP-4-dehydrorhamnose 3,5-epimerase